MFGNVKGQEESRHVEHFYDQHQREYVANVENMTGHPCEVLRALFVAPIGPDWFEGKLTPPAKYVRILSQSERRGKTYNVEVDYPAWIQDLETREDEFHQKIVDLVRGSTKGTADIEKLVNDPPPVINDLVGVKPFPPVTLVQAMAAGNAWAVGLSEKVPTKAAALLEELRPIIMRRARKALGADPLADETDSDEFMREVALNVSDPFEDLEEMLDPNATGGKRVPVRRPRRTAEA